MPTGIDCSPRPLQWGMLLFTAMEAKPSHLPSIPDSFMLCNAVGHADVDCSGGSKSSDLQSMPDCFMPCNAVGHLPLLCMLCDCGDHPGGIAVCGAQGCPHRGLPLPVQETLVLEEVQHTHTPRPLTHSLPCSLTRSLAHSRVPSLSPRSLSVTCYSLI